MDFYKKLTDYSSATRERLETLNKEEKLDTLLQDASQKCPYEVLRFIFEHRRYNRDTTRDITQKCFFEQISQYRSTNNNVSTVYERVITERDICDVLRGIRFTM
jgi:hypothetical protein